MFKSGKKYGERKDREWKEQGRKMSAKGFDLDRRAKALAAEKGISYAKAVEALQNSDPQTFGEYVYGR